MEITGNSTVTDFVAEVKDGEWKVKYRVQQGMKIDDQEWVYKEVVSQAHGDDYKALIEDVLETIGRYLHGLNGSLFNELPESTEEIKQ